MSRPRLLGMTEDQRRAMYLAAYTERYGRSPRITPEFVPTTRTTR